MKATVIRYLTTITLLVFVWLGNKYAVALAITLMTVGEELKCYIIRRYYGKTTGLPDKRK